MVDCADWNSTHNATDGWPRGISAVTEDESTQEWQTDFGSNQLVSTGSLALYGVTYLAQTAALGLVHCSNGVGNGPPEERTVEECELVSPWREIKAISVRILHVCILYIKSHKT